MDPFTEAAANLLASLERDGGAFTITGIVLVGVFMITKYMLKDVRAESERRERDQGFRHADVLRRADEALARERDNSLEHQRRTDRVIDVVESNTKALTTLVVASNRQDDLLNRINLHLATTQKRTQARAKQVNGNGERPAL